MLDQLQPSTLGQLKAELYCGLQAAEALMSSSLAQEAVAAVVVRPEVSRGWSLAWSSFRSLNTESVQLGTEIPNTSTQAPHPGTQNPVRDVACNAWQTGVCLSAKT